MQRFILGIIYLMFFLSGAAALMYQVVWVRSLSLVFGGSHLAVTAVLSIFMAGLAMGSYIIGKYVDRITKTLRLYGILEIGVALFAVVFVWLTKIYPDIYIFLVRGKDDSYIYITLVRVVFSVIALIIPTTLMGGTLPVLARFISRQPEKIRSSLSFLYGFNTLGAVLGASAAGFFLLRVYSVSFTLKTAVLMNLIIGAASILLQNKGDSILESAGTGDGLKRAEDRAYTEPDVNEDRKNLFPLKLVLFGVGVSGFCALGYEVLWTRILSIVAGASVYSFTTMLVAFLTGIALGSEAFGLLPGVFKVRDKGIRRSIVWFGIVQVVIGVTALVVTAYIRYLPQISILLQGYFSGMRTDMFGIRLWVNFAIAYAYMTVPAFFMGVAFPLAGKVHTEYKRRVGSAVGEVLAYNTIGAIFGAAVSGFLLIYLFGIERSLQMLTVINIGFGLLVIISTVNIRRLNWSTAVLTAAVLALLALNPNVLRIWDMKFFAVYRNNQPDAFRTPEMIKEAVDNTDILYYAEGTEATISSIKVKGKGGVQGLSVNGKVVASTHMEGQQCQLTLGHLPMLLHKDPKKVLVVGLGTGMTLGATSVHPEVEEVTLVEIEPKVIGGARTFADYNHNVLDDPKLKIVFNDGRNFLLTTNDRYDVITADPIHPWAQGASYLYTEEYFAMASERLRPGGIMCQWLPVYELSTQDIKSVVKTFSRNFRYTMLWLTHHDAELIGSNSPIVIDEEELARRIQIPHIAADLKRVNMGSATDFLSYFITGTDGLNEFSRDGVINTDDNLYLEFSSPLSIAEPTMTENLITLSKYMDEGILPYLALSENAAAREEQEAKWGHLQRAARISIMAQALFVGQLQHTPEFNIYMNVLNGKYPEFAPGNFLQKELENKIAKAPSLIQKTRLVFMDRLGKQIEIEIAAVNAPISSERTKVAFVDNDARIIYGQSFFEGMDVDKVVKRYAGEVMDGVRAVYQRELQFALSRGEDYPAADAALKSIEKFISKKTKENG